MSSPAALEIILSLTLQITVLYLVTGWIESREKCDEAKDRLWKAFYVLALALTALAWVGPHLRLLPASMLIHPEYVSRFINWQQYIAMIVLGVWIAGVAVGIFLLVLSIWKSVRTLRETQPVEPTVKQSLMSDVQKDLRSGRQIEFRTAENITSPYCWQFSRPLIVLPSHLLGAPPEIARAIVSHELCHLRAGHPLHLFLQRLVEILYWYHPYVWLASHRATLHREFIADSEAVRSREEAIHYLKGMMLLAECRTGSQRFSAGLAFGGAGSQIQERVQRLAEKDWDTKEPLSGKTPWMKLTAATGLCMVIWLPVSVAASSREIWSPWPQWSAMALHELGFSVRDYEIDSHRMLPHHHEPSPPRLK